MLEAGSERSTNKSEPQVVIGERGFWSKFKYRAGTEIFAEAETADYVYRILSGAVRTIKLLPDGRRQIGAFYLPGDIFGVENGDAPVNGGDDGLANSSESGPAPDPLSSSPGAYGS
jgi:hypothetical protein